MIKSVQKRDGRIVPFEKEKIVIAISKAGFVEEETKWKIANEIANKNKEIITIEEIQDLVERKLMRTAHKDVAKSYINHRQLHSMARNGYDELMGAISQKLEATDVQNQNANMDERSFGGRVGEASNLLLEKYALEFCMTKEMRDAHLNNEIYIHDLNSFAIGNHNCLTIPFDDLLEKGFNTRQTDVRPAQSINTAMQLVAVIIQLQSLQQFGGVAASHIDWTMIPYVRLSFAKHYAEGMKYLKWDESGEYENLDKQLIRNTSINDEMWTKDPMVHKYALDMTIKELYQAVEGMYHNLNTLQSRSGNQLPFSSLNYGTCTLEEGRMVTKALLETSIKGVGKLRKTAIFPCGIFKLKKGVNRAEGDPNYDLYKLALMSTAQRLYPNYANVDWSGNAGYDENDPRTEFSTMGCRTANGWDINGFGQLKDGRGNICPVTIILPTLAMQAKEMFVNEYDSNIVDVFMEYLERKIGEAKDSLIYRFDWICSQNPASAKFMYENGLMAGYVPEEGIRSALKHGTLAIGMLGLAETLQILIGKDHTTPEGMKLAKRICGLYKDLCAKYKEKYRLNFGVYFTPAENLCYKAMKKFQAKYGVMENISDKEFFTNSMHVPVWKEMNPFEKIDIESQLTGYSSAGCITYIELDSSVIQNIEALETIVNYAMDKDIPYFAVNVPNDTCMACGYCDDIGVNCPVCGSTDIQRLRRVTGYLTGDYKSAFNRGKQQEVEMRVRHL